MPTAVTQISTAHASRYIAQLCKHFRHKVPASWDANSGEADFGLGRCRMAAADGTLTLTCLADTAEGLGRVRLIVEDHVVRFAWRESLTVAWTEMGD